MNETTNTENGNAVGGSRLKRLVMFLWDGLGTPGAWTLLLIVTFTISIIGGQTVFTSFWMAVCTFAYFLARIAVAVEKIAESSTGT
jgi:hypothetical protein